MKSLGGAWRDDLCRSLTLPSATTACIFNLVYQGRYPSRSDSIGEPVCGCWELLEGVTRGLIMLSETKEYLR